MRKFVLALEGGDGSGKSTAALCIAQLCREMGVAFKLIGRGVDDASPRIYALTKVLRDHGSGYSLESDLVIRVAREFVRADEAAKVESGIVVLDRFVLSVLARSKTEKIDLHWLEANLATVVKLSELDATIFVDCSFNIALKRIQESLEIGNRGISHKDTRGEDFNREFVANQRLLFDRTTLAKRRFVVDNSGDAGCLAKSVRQILTPIAEQIVEPQSM